MSRPHYTIAPNGGYEGNRMKLQIVEMIQTMETNYE